MTKHQLSAEVFTVVPFPKEIRPSSPIPLLKRNNNKNFSLYLVFSHWFLVKGLSNEKNIKSLNKIFLFSFIIATKLCQLINQPDVPLLLHFKVYRACVYPKKSFKNSHMAFSATCKYLWGYSRSL